MKHYEEKGKFIEFKLKSFFLQGFNFDGTLYLIFRHSTLNYFSAKLLINLDFQLEINNTEYYYNGYEISILKILFDFIGKQLESTITDKRGNLKFTFEDQSNFIISEGEWERWESVIKNEERQTQALHAIGGSSTISIFTN